MYKLLIVDDERHVVDWLSKLFQQYPEFDLEIYKAYTGTEALKILESSRIDVVLSDIRMPGMDGFALADRIYQNWPKARVIFLTGYDDFDYAYRANQYSNLRFIMKTEDDDVIIAAVTAAIREIEREMAQAEIHNQAIIWKKMIQYYINRKLLDDTIEGKKRKNDPIRWKGSDLHLDFHQPMLLLLIYFQQERQLFDFFEHAKRALYLRQMLENILDQQGVSFVFDWIHGCFACLLQPAPTAGSEPDAGYAHLLFYFSEMLENLMQAIHNMWNSQVFIAIYDQPILCDQIRNVCEDLNLFLEDAVLKEPLTSAYYKVSKSELNAVRAKSGKILNEYTFNKRLSNLQDFLEQGSRAGFEQALDKIAEPIRKIKSRHYLPAIEIYFRISVIYLSYINRHHLADTLAFHIGLHKLYRLEEDESWEESFAYLKKLGGLLFDIHEEGRLNKNEMFVELIRQYIQKNLDKDLSLTAISEGINYNSSYVSRLFKQITGINLFEYINSARLEHAKELLTTTNDTSIEIAQKVGFVSSQYFSTVFKKNTGMTPADYRRKSHGGA